MLRNLSKYILLSGILILPLIYWPKGEVPYELPKVWFFQRLVEVLGILGTWKFLKEKQKYLSRRNDKVLIFLIFIFLFFGIVSSLLGVDFTKSIFGNYYRHDGLITLFHFAVFFFFLNLFWEKSWEKSLFLAISLGCFLTSLWTVGLGFRFHILKDYSIYHFGNALGGTFGQPNFLAGYLLVCLPFSAYFVSKSRCLGEKFFLVACFISSY